MAIARPDNLHFGRLQKLANTTLLIKTIAAAISYGFTILCARTMDAAEFGQVAVFLSAALFLSVLGAQGQQVSALRFLPPLWSKRETNTARTFVKWAQMRAVITTACVVVAALLLSLLAASFGLLPGYSQATIWLGLMLIPLVGWVDFQSHVARGLGKLQLALLPKEVTWRALAALAIVSLWLGGRHVPIGAATVLLILVLTLLVICVVQTLVLYNLTDLTREPVDGNINPEWKKSATPFWISSVSNMFLVNADVLVVGVMVNPEIAGMYFAANRLAMVLAFFQTSHNVVLGPALAQTWQTQGPGPSGRIIRRSTWEMTKPTVFLGGLLFLFAESFLSLFGPEFTVATTPLRFLILAGILNAALGPGDIALNMCGFHRAAMRANLALLLVNSAILICGGTLGGAQGVALAVLISTAIRKLAFWGLAWHLLSLRTDAVVACWQRRETAEPQ